jgi:hypothetical protein
MATHVRLGSLGNEKTQNLHSCSSMALNAASSSQNPITTVHKHGVLHHAFPRTLAPYPVSHDHRVIDAYVVSILWVFLVHLPKTRDSLDLAFRMELSGGNPSTSITEYQLDNPKTHPRRCLDIGCGSGAWTVLSFVFSRLSHRYQRRLILDIGVRNGIQRHSLGSISFVQMSHSISLT